MREIKFRAWDIRSNKWLPYFDNLTLPLGHMSNFANRSGIILMQFTRIKDKNGSEIYEGDIVKHPNGNKPCQVVWNDQQHGWRRADKDGRALVGRLTSEYEVLGNIYENPELLEKLL